jgi:short-subunit dehydrogenase
MTHPKSQTICSAWVLGSTSTVAKAICLSLAERGCHRFHLLARNPARNQALASELRDRFSAEVSCEPVDLLAPPEAQPLLSEMFDLYLVAAGSIGDAERARIDTAEAQAITQANFTGLIPWLTAIVSPERIQKPGALWVFSSVAADRGRPSNYHYGAAKAGLLRFCEGLLLRCHGTPFAVRILKAGFIASPMTEGKAPALLCANPEQIARDLLRNPRRRGIETIPWWWTPLMALVRRLPARLAARL